MPAFLGKLKVLLVLCALYFVLVQYSAGQEKQF